MYIETAGLVGKINLYINITWGIFSSLTELLELRISKEDNKGQKAYYTLHTHTQIQILFGKKLFQEKLSVGRTVVSRIKV